MCMDTLDDNKTLNIENKSSSQSQLVSTSRSTLCIVCFERQRALGLVPCGHFNVCVPCGHSLKSCPTCGSNIKGLIRIYD
ncbi:unnamed protein product [Adineta steineri]|uniref:RING-type domain-containing protein n=1 Tax=Adineta steineri TaxID=433720 RepID=A0A820CS68_9BILA|nr:unnamed protein product [Adineta steineri]